jgi:hypothetical protein
LPHAIHSRRCRAGAAADWGQHPPPHSLQPGGTAPHSAPLSIPLHGVGRRWCPFFPRHVFPSPHTRATPLGMAIRVRVRVTHEFQTRRVRAWVQFCTLGLHPHPTRIETGLGTSLVFDPWVTQRVPKKSPTIFFTRHARGPAQLGDHLNAQAQASLCIL